MQLNIHVSQIIKISSKTANHEIAFIAFPGYKKTVVLNDSSHTTHAFVLFSKVETKALPERKTVFTWLSMEYDKKRTT